MIKLQPAITRIHWCLSLFTRMGAWLAGLSLCLLFILGFFDIISRLITGQGLGIALEYSGYLVAACLFLGTGWTLLQDGHIQVKILHSKIPHAMQRPFNTALYFFGLIVSSILAYGLTGWTYGTFTSNQLSYFTSQTPLYLPQFIVTLGPYMLCTAFLVKIIDSLWNIKDKSP